MRSQILLLENATDQESNSFDWLRFFFIAALATILTMLNNVLLIDDNMYFEFYASQLTYERIEEFIQMKDQYTWFGYVMVPIVYLFKITAVACCLSLGSFLSTRPLLFNKFFRIATQAELVLLMGVVCKLIWFLFINTSYGLSDIQTFYPLALTNLFPHDIIPTWGVYPLQQLNLFELAYWFALAYGISQVIEIPMPKAFGMVAASYGSGLLVWVVFVMFLTVSLS
jgi:hypothetical protein